MIAGSNRQEIADRWLGEIPMTPEDMDAWLANSLQDRRLSRSERQALGAMTGSLGSTADRDLIRRKAFEIARTALPDPTLLDWLEDVLKAVRDDAETARKTSVAEAYFSPGEDCRRAIIGLLERSRNTVEVCVFTITDDRLADALLGARRNGVSIRVITDNAKAEDLGSDVGRLEQAGIPVRVDRSPYHMHHKFAVFDAATLLTGSYNWTRGAAVDNEENLIVSNEPRLVSPYRSAFERLWASLA
jgi:mitochondrial cardiolipin hydrolase